MKLACICTKKYPKTTIRGKQFCTNCGHAIIYNNLALDTESADYPQMAVDAVIEYINNRVPSELSSLIVARVALDEVYVVGFTKVLKSWKAHVVTTHEDRLLFEVTFGGDAEVSIDVYRKIDKAVLQEAELFPGE